MSTHRTLDGDWVACLDPTHCELLFHVDESPAAAALMPLPFLLAIARIVDPPTPEDAGYYAEQVEEFWLDGEGYMHRDYDLPASVGIDGRLEWWQHGYMHRGHDRPAVVDNEGLQAWYADDRLHRVAGPAVINTGEPASLPNRSVANSGSVLVQGEEYWLYGRRVEPQVWAATRFNPPDFTPIPELKPWQRGYVEA